MEYIRLGEIQAMIIEHYNKFQHGLAFTDAIIKLSENGRVQHGTPEMPDFFTWDIYDLDQLKELVSQIPIGMDELNVFIGENRKNEISKFFQEKLSVQINLEFYTPEVFYELPYITVIYVVSGTAVFHTPDRSISLQCGDIIILAPKRSYYISCTPQDAVVSIHSTQDLFETHFLHLLSQNELLSDYFYKSLTVDHGDFLHLFLYPSEKILLLIKNLFAEFASQEAFSTDIFLNYLQILYANILKTLDRENDQDHLSKEKSSIASILFYIQKNYKQVTLNELAEQFNYAPAYMSRLLKQKTGYHLPAIKNKLKIKEAEKLLINTNYSVYQIAEMTGYSSADHFTYSFKKVHDCTPKEFRNRNELL
ncbi:MAG: helix-turn-helix transcriptional regulator [Lachnospiraceae bacterium]